MNNKITLYTCFLLILASLVFTTQAQQPCSVGGTGGPYPTKCFEIEGIMVNACTSNEGYDEQVRLRIGPNPLQLNTINNVNWPTANSWMGFATFNSTNLNKINTINNSIIAAGNCGRLIKVNPTEVVPAYARLLIITSTVFSATAIDFSGLRDTMYVALQNNSSNASGHFGNYASGSSNEVLIIRAGSCGDTIAYSRAQLLKTDGTIGNEDGASVNYSFNGTPTYVNYGCVLPVTPVTCDAGTLSGTYCSGSSINLSGTVTGTSCYWWYPQNRSAGTFVDSTALAPTFNISSAFTGTLKFYLRANSGCGFKLDSVSITVNPPTGSITITPLTDTVLCNRSTLNLTVAPAGTILWTTTGKGSYNQNNTLTPVYTPTANDTSLVWFTATRSSSCGTLKDSVRVRFFGPRSPAFTASDTLVCTGSGNITLTPLVAGGTFSGAHVSGQTFAPPATPGVYTVKYVVGSGACADSTTRNIHVVASANASFTLSDTVVCRGSAITLTPVTSGGTYYGATVVANTFTPNTPGIYSISYVLGNGTCRDSVARTYRVTVPPSAAFTLSDTVVCAGSTITLTPVTSGGTYYGPSVTSNQFTVGNTPGVYVISYVTGSGTCRDSVAHTYRIVANPNAVFTASDTVLCTGSLATLNPALAGGIFSGTGVTLNQFSTNTAGIYTVTYTLTQGACSSKDSLRIRVVNRVSAAFSLSDTVMCLGNGNITVTPAQPGGTFGGVTLTGNTYIPQTAGTFALWYVRDNGICKDSVYRTFRVQAKPDASFTISDTSLCQGASAVTFTPTVSGGVFKGTDVSGNSFTPNQVGVWPVKYAVTQGACADSTTRLILVAPTVNAAFSVSDTLVCYVPGVTVQVTPVQNGGTWKNVTIAGGVFTPAAAGTYWITYIQDNGICYDSVSRKVEVINKTSAAFTVSDTLLCEGDAPVQFTPDVAGGAFTGTPLNAANQFMPNTAGTYKFTYTTGAAGCKDSVTKTIRVAAKPVPSFSYLPKPAVVNDSVLFTYTGSAASAYLWNFGDAQTSSLQNPVHQYLQGKVYPVMLWVTTIDGCKDSVALDVEVLDDEALFVPNVFTPNGDSINDRFVITHKGISNYEIVIYNRWGTLVYDSKNPDDAWDGTFEGVTCPESVYVYLLTYTGQSGRARVRNGTVTLIR